MYKVIKAFTDLHDDSYSYGVGDTFPRQGVKVTKSRLSELASDKNRQGTPLIKEVEETEEAQAVEEIAEEAEDTTAKKRRRTTKK